MCGGPRQVTCVDYVYAPSGQLKEVCDPTRTTCYWRADQRNAADQIEVERYGNNVYATRTYRPTGHVSSILTTRPGAATLDHLVYGYDDNRNVTLREDKVGTNARRQDFTYDQLNRLKTWQVSAGATTTFTYNSIGNIASETAGSGPSIIYAYGQNNAPPHALTTRGSATYSYDGAGRQVTGPNRAIEFNRFNLPASITRAGQVTEFDYDAEGSRVLKRDPTETVVSLVGLFERRTAANIRNVHYVMADGQPVAQITRIQTTPTTPSTSPEILYLQRDAQGNVTQTTRAQCVSTAPAWMKCWTCGSVDARTWAGVPYAAIWPWWRRAIMWAMRKVEAMSWEMTMLVMSNCSWVSWIMSSMLRVRRGSWPVVGSS